MSLLAALPLNWLETTILLVIWAALVVDVLRQQWISRGAKIAWIVFIILVPVVSSITYGIVTVEEWGQGDRQEACEPASSPSGGMSCEQA